MKITMSPYLNFNGKCEEAMKFYQKVLGGELSVQKFKDNPQMKVPQNQKNLVIHAALTHPMFSLMASDGRPEYPVAFGTSVHLSLMGTDKALLTKYFRGLVKGGRVDMPLAKQFWGDTFGMLTDKFGIHWMVNIGASAQTAKKKSPGKRAH